MNKKIKELTEKIEELELNLKRIKEAERECTCDDGEPHYHVLVSEDGTGNEYIAETDKEHKKNIKEFAEELEQLKKKLEKHKKKKTKNL